jgi:hypothetical protein
MIVLARGDSEAMDDQARHEEVMLGKSLALNRVAFAITDFFSIEQGEMANGQLIADKTEKTRAILSHASFIEKLRPDQIKRLVLNDRLDVENRYREIITRFDESYDQLLASYDMLLAASEIERKTLLLVSITDELGTFFAVMEHLVRVTNQIESEYHILIQEHFEQMGVRSRGFLIITIGEVLALCLFVSLFIYYKVRSEARLVSYQEHLEEMVKERTQELRSTNFILKREVISRTRTELRLKETIEELHDALGKVRTLSGFLPICANCKKIRDDDGYWHQVESYVRRHANVEFSHGLCPSCANDLYPELSNELEE